MRHSAAVLAASLLAACGNPTDPQGWAKRAASRSRIDEKLEALAAGAQGARATGAPRSRTSSRS